MFSIRLSVGRPTRSWKSQAPHRITMPDVCSPSCQYRTCPVFCPKEFRAHERTEPVLGDDEFQRRLEKNLGRVLRRQKPGPKKVSKR